MAVTWARRSRSPTICWTPRARREETGKTAGKDAAAGKATMVAVLGLGAGAGAGGDAGAPGGRAIWSGFGERGRLLRALADFVVTRRN